MRAAKAQTSLLICTVSPEMYTRKCVLVHWRVAKAKAQASLRSCCMNTKHKLVFNFPKYVYFRSLRIRENAQSFQRPVKY